MSGYKGDYVVIPESRQNVGKSVGIKIHGNSTMNRKPVNVVWVCGCGLFVSSLYRSLSMVPEMVLGFQV